MFGHIILNSTSTKPQVPIAIAPTLPHFGLKFGLPESSVNTQLMLIIDTSLVLCVESVPFMLKIIENYPNLVKSIIYENNEYSPIQLLGIITDNKFIDSTHIPKYNLFIVVELFLVYDTKNNAKT